MTYCRLVFIFLLISLSIKAQVPATEVRAVWLTTNWGLDWPTKGASVEAQKKQLQNILDQVKADNFNTVLFQTRAQGHVFYRSKIESLSPFFTHGSNFDPLAFAIEECHKRGLECHAWIIAYPMGKAKVKYTGRGKKRKATIAETKPGYYKEMGGQWYLDPGMPETRNLLKSIVREIVANYDVDGIHFDYIRYPSNTRKFPDEDTYKKYGRGKDLYDWRRDNITQLVTEVYDEVKSMKKWVQISSSPLGRYKILPEVHANDGWTAYETVFQDAGHWMKSGKHDLVFPMMYYKERHFYPFLHDWIANSNGRLVVPGLGVYQMDENDWSIDDITNQMKYIRNNEVKGTAYFRTGNILNNLKGIRDSIHVYYPTPAKLPSLNWLDNVAPNSPDNLQVYKDKEGFLNLTWDASENDEVFTYTVYVSGEEDIDRNNPHNILATGLRTNNYSFRVREGEFGYYYSVTASDRYHNESIICYPAYFVHTEEDH
ncbi:MAG: family 10 glycosylhydrolase [Dysgonomonas sp.]|nr:family 10 glycosylhydrolase [Dysgonomonas sp.]